MTVVKETTFSVLILLFVLAGCHPPASPPGAEAPEPVLETTPTPIPTHNETGDLAIYLVKGKVSPEQIIEPDFDALEVDDTPIIAAGEILAYTWESHTMTLNTDAYRRLAQLEGPIIHGPGLPFVLCVGPKPIYGGLLWSSMSSATFGGILIDVYPAALAQPLPIQAGYPSPDWFAGEDLRADPRIRQALEAAGKLQ